MGNKTLWPTRLDNICNKIFSPFQIDLSVYMSLIVKRTLTDREMVDFSLDSHDATTKINPQIHQSF